METKPDTIKISATAREEISATHADLLVTVKGSSLVSGREALKKAREVSHIVEELTKLGISNEHIQLQGVFIESSTGAVTKSSSATYRLRIRCEKLDLIPDLLEVITKQKNSGLERIEWKYLEEAALQRNLEAAISKAKVKAEKTAGTLGVSLLGVYDFIENIMDEEVPHPYLQAQPASRSLGITPAGPPALGMDIHHTKSVQINVDIWYRVSAFSH